MSPYPLTLEQEQRIEKDFNYHAPKQDQIQRYEDVRSTARAFALGLSVICPPSRELSLALTKLEECAMWANASIARNE